MLGLVCILYCMVKYVRLYLQERIMINMEMIKRTYSLPKTTVRTFEAEVKSGKRSAVVTELIEDWLEEQRRKRLRESIIEGCHDMKDVYLEVEQEYHPLEEEVHRALDS